MLSEKKVILMTIKVGVAGLGAIGSAVCRALTEKQGIAGIKLICVSDIKDSDYCPAPNVSFKEMANRVDLIIECLPAHIVPDLAEAAFALGKNMIVISSASLILFPEILQKREKSKSRIFVPSGALAGLDGVKAMRQMGISSALIASTKPPKGFANAPYIIENKLDLEKITKKTLLFTGNALEASKGFPANVNVAATLSLVGIGPEKTQVEIWADPNATGNTHQITVKSAYSTLKASIENMPDPANPKSSVLAAQSIIATLHDLNNSVVIA